MSIVLLDTNIASLLHPKKKAAVLRRRYEPHMRGQTLALSFQSVAELWDWAEANRWGAKARHALDPFIRRFLVIPFDIGLAKAWARVMEAARQEGRRLESGDCWIAATAVHHGITLLTHDRDLVDRNINGLQVISYIDEDE